MMRLTKDKMPNTENPFKSLECVLAFDSRDWSKNENDAWIWGIVVGWGTVYEEIALQHNWDKETVSRLKRLHLIFLAVQRNKN